MITELICLQRHEPKLRNRKSRILRNLLKAGCEMERISRNGFAVLRTPGGEVVHVPVSPTRRSTSYGSKSGISQKGMKILRAEGLL